MPAKYFGSFSSLEDVKRNFAEQDRNYKPKLLTGIVPTEDEILFAAYEGGDYEGAAIVLFEQDGKLYEVNGGHCSCYGLEGQWLPEETSWEAIALRPNTKEKAYGLSSWDYELATREAFQTLVDSHLGEKVQ